MTEMVIGRKNIKKTVMGLQFLKFSNILRRRWGDVGFSSLSKFSLLFLQRISGKKAGKPELTRDHLSLF